MFFLGKKKYPNLTLFKQWYNSRGTNEEKGKIWWSLSGDCIYRLILTGRKYISSQETSVEPTEKWGHYLWAQWIFLITVSIWISLSETFFLAVVKLKIKHCTVFFLLCFVILAINAILSYSFYCFIQQFVCPDQNGNMLYIYLKSTHIPKSARLHTGKE